MKLFLNYRLRLAVTLFSFNKWKQVSIALSICLVLIISSPQNSQVSAESDKPLLLWKKRTYGEVKAVSISPDGEYVVAQVFTGFGKKELQLYKNATLLWKRKLGLWENLRGFSLDGKYLISGNKNGSVLVWQLENGLLQQNFMAHNALITDIAISKDGTLLATTSTDRTIKLWEISNGHVEIFPLTSYVGHEAPVTSVSFQPTGEYLASGSEDTTIRLWFIPVASVP